MKILILANFDVGLYQFRRELIAELLKAHEVVISLPNGDLVRPLEEMGCRFIDTPMERRGINPVTDLKLLARYLRLVQQEKPDLVITYTIKPNVYGGMVCRLLGIPYAANITGLGTAFQKQGMLRRLVIFLYKTALRKAKVVFFENAENMQTLQDEGIIRPEKCCLLNGAGVNVEHYAYMPYPTEDTPVRFLFVGRVMREKGVDELFSAMERLREAGFDCTLDVVGGFEENYANQMAEGAAQGWLNYHGFQKDVRPFIAQAHCFVLPSWHEGMANTNLESAATGRPVITSDIHGCKEAVAENISGLLCKPQDADSLYNAMMQFLKTDRADREAMGRAGRARMEALFDKKKVVAATLRALRPEL
ncbi:MAG: glycosyltransferase family 4 protein [Oscillospiraceae bacterium]|nr:glycosyltransferase family 4 protein [Oscillospiraceae bacterium]